MTDLTPLLHGLLLGFSIAAPVGPIGVLCIRRTLADGPWMGFVSGMGAATADAAYGAIAAFGLTALSQPLLTQAFWMRLIGGLFLIGLGVRTMFARPGGQTSAPVRAGALAAYGSTLMLTLTNPMTILAFAAAFAGLGMAGEQGGTCGASLLVAGVFLGSAAWWLTLSSLVARLRRHLSLRALHWVNRGSGAILVGFGVVVLTTLARSG